MENENAEMTSKDYMEAIPQVHKAVQLAAEMAEVLDPSIRFCFKGAAPPHLDDLTLVHEMRKVQEAAQLVQHFLVARAKHLFKLKEERERAEKIEPRIAELVDGRPLMARTAAS